MQIISQIAILDAILFLTMSILLYDVVKTVRLFKPPDQSIVLIRNEGADEVKYNNLRVFKVFCLESKLDSSSKQVWITTVRDAASEQMAKQTALQSHCILGNFLFSISIFNQDQSKQMTFLLSPIPPKSQWFFTQLTEYQTRLTQEYIQELAGSVLFISCCNLVGV